MLDYNLFYDVIPKDEIYPLTRHREFMKIVKTFKGQTITIECPLCHRQQQADMAYYLIGRRYMGHPYTCGCGDRIEMIMIKEE